MNSQVSSLHAINKIDKLTFFISEACTLNCRYCHVRLPDAENRERTMSEETARNIVRRIFSQFESCNFVQFSGGEPTLNMPAVRAIVDEIRCMVSQGIILQPPGFGIVTNGASRHAPEMVAFCREHDIAATVSLDGPRYIHDALRPSAQGMGSFDEAVTTIEALLASRVSTAIETVYTSSHIDQGCSIVDLLRFTAGLGVKKLIFHTAYPPAPLELYPFDDSHFERLLDCHLEAVNWWFESLLYGGKAPVDVYFRELLVPLLESGGADVACGGRTAGFRDVAVGPDGDVYACHLLYKFPQFYSGNVLSGDHLPQGMRLPVHTDDPTECASCFARHWCRPCGALNPTWGDAWRPPRRECMLRQVVLFRIGELAFKHLSIPVNTMTEVLRQAAEG